MGPYGPVWAHMGPVCARTGTCMPVWARVGPYWPVWARPVRTGPHGPVRTHMGAIISSKQYDGKGLPTKWA